MKRIALSLAALGVLAVFNTPATASDLSVLLRRLSHGQFEAFESGHGTHVWTTD